LWDKYMETCQRLGRQRTMAIVWYCDQLISLCPVLVPGDIEGKSLD